MGNNIWKKLLIIENIIILAAVILCVGIMIGKKTTQEPAKGVLAQVNDTTATSTSAEVTVAETTAAVTETASKKESTVAFTSKDIEGLEIEFVPEENWGSETELFYKYKMVVKNTSSKAIEGWAISAEVGEDFQLNSSWNGDFELVDGVLTIVPTEFAANLEAGKTIEDVGFICQVKEEPDWEKLEMGIVEEAAGDDTSGSKDNTTSLNKDLGGNIMVSGKLSVSGNNLVDEDGNKVVLKGVSTHGIGWYPQYVNYDSFKSLKDYGANVVRLAMYTAENGGYCTDGDKTKLKQLVFDGVEHATSLSMYAIIDWHILSDNNPETNKEEAKKFFDEVSKKYADYDNVIYEICNEPNGGVSWDNVKKYAEEVIGVIRANDPDGIILVGTPTWSQDVDIAAKNPITKYDNIMYTLHFYAATHKEDLQKKLQTALDAGLPVFISEFSICDASGNGQLDYDSADKWLEFIRKNNISYVGWNLSNKNESSSILKESCTKTSDYKLEDLNDSGKWLLESFQ